MRVNALTAGLRAGVEKCDEVALRALADYLEEVQDPLAEGLRRVIEAGYRPYTSIVAPANWAWHRQGYGPVRCPYNLPSKVFDRLPRKKYGSSFTGHNRRYHAVYYATRTNALLALAEAMMVG